VEGATDKTHRGHFRFLVDTGTVATVHAEQVLRDCTINDSHRPRFQPVWPYITASVCHASPRLGAQSGEACNEFMGRQWPGNLRVAFVRIESGK
jgi:hypothetical protein